MAWEECHPSCFNFHNYTTTQLPNTRTIKIADISYLATSQYKCYKVDTSAATDLIVIA